MARISINALVCTQNAQSFYVSIMNSADLNEMCFVSRKKEDPEKGFQRLLSEKRASEIAKYLDSGGVIPPALILSAQPNAMMSYDKTKKILSMERVKESLLVLDGQHRLYGLRKARNIYDFPVVIFEHLNSQREVRQFIDINTTQKGVPTALILDIKSQAGTETKIEERQKILFNKLNESSVLAGYLLPNESKAGKISRTTFNQSTESIYQGGPLSNASDNVIYQAVYNYLAAIDSVFKSSGSPDAKLTKNIMFRAIMSLFNDVCDKCLSIYGNLKEESLVNYLKPLSSLDYSSYTGTNKATQSRIILDIKSLLRQDFSFNEDLF